MAEITESSFIQALQSSIRSQIEGIIAEEAEKAAERVRSRVADVAPSMATRLLSHFDMYRDERRIVIEVRKLAGES